VLITAAVALDSPGPVVFGQERIGLGRRKFRMWKFRTMAKTPRRRSRPLEGRNEVNGAAFKMKEDPRVTRAGRLLRKLSLDELPQLLNVLSGDMSLVGPRPLPARDVARLAEPWQQRRFSMKPGLTCLWPSQWRHEISFDHWMELDLQYTTGGQPVWTSRSCSRLFRPCSEGQGPARTPLDQHGRESVEASITTGMRVAWK